MNDCVFCKISKHEIPSAVQFEDNDIIAFNDIEPKAKVHILVVPKKHIPTIKDVTDADTELLGKLIIAAKNIAAEKGLAGYKLIFNVGREGGQIIDHVHLHLIAGQDLKSIV